jgi:hypothetical protein
MFAGVPYGQKTHAILFGARPVIPPLFDMHLPDQRLSSPASKDTFYYAAVGVASRASVSR